jgi:hypothetical protein
MSDSSSSMSSSTSASTSSTSSSTSVPVTSSSTIDNTQTLIATVTTQLSQSLSSKSINSSNLILLASEAMQLVEVYPALSGSDKETIVLKVLANIINCSSLSETDKVVMNGLLNDIMPTVISLVVRASNGLLALNLGSKCSGGKCCTVC